MTAPMQLKILDRWLKSFRTVQEVIEHRHGKVASTQCKIYGPHRHVYFAMSIFAFATLARFAWGFPPIYNMLIKADAYIWLCEDRNSKIYENGILKLYKCIQQSDAINHLYTISTSTMLITSAFAGFLNSFGGARICAIFGCTCMFLGTVLMGASNERFRAYIPAAMLIGLGRDPVVFSFMNTTALYPKRELSVLSFLSACGSIGTLNPLVLEMLGEKFNLNVHDLFISYGVLCALPPLFFAIAFQPPKRFYSQKELDKAILGISSARSEAEELAEASKYQRILAYFGIRPKDHITFKESFSNPHFYLAGITFAFTMLISTYYMNGTPITLNETQRYVLSFAIGLSAVPGLIISTFLDHLGCLFIMWFQCISCFLVLLFWAFDNDIAKYMSIIAYGCNCTFLCAQFWLFALDVFHPSIQTFMMGSLHCIGGLAVRASPLVYELFTKRQGASYMSALPIFLLMGALNMVNMGILQYVKWKKPRVF